MTFEGLCEYVNILREVKVHHLRGGKHLRDDDYYNDISSSFIDHC